MNNDGQDALISKEDNIVNAVTEVTEEEIRGAVRKIGPLATVVRISSKFVSSPRRGLSSMPNPI